MKCWLVQDADWMSMALAKEMSEVAAGTTENTNYKIKNKVMHKTLYSVTISQKPKRLLITTTGWPHRGLAATGRPQIKK
jgi:hypothetical protein